MYRCVVCVVNHVISYLWFWWPLCVVVTHVSVVVVVRCMLLRGVIVVCCQLVVVACGCLLLRVDWRCGVLTCAGCG